MNENQYIEHLQRAQEGLKHSIRVGLQVIPVFGSALDQTIFGIQDVIQIERLKKFAESMQEIINSGAIQEDTLLKINNYLKSEDGQEYIYLIGEKVKKTRSKTKLEYIRNLFFNHTSTKKPLDLDKAERYLDLIEILDIESILLLDFLNSFLAKIPPFKDTIPFLSDNGSQMTYVEAASKTFELEREDLDFYNQQLISNGLAIDDSMERQNTRPLDVLKITKRGKLFLEFIFYT